MYNERHGQPEAETAAVDLPDNLKTLERAAGIEPAYTAWEAVVLPLNYARNSLSGSALL
jgi:hypothetical protein